MRADELPPGGTFVDDDGNIHEGFIEAIAREGVTRGCGRERYCPSDDVTRGEMAAFVRRSLALPASSVDHFSDDDGHLFEGDINALAAAGITRGCRGGTGYCPDEVLKRGQIAAFINRALDLPPATRDYFSDDDGIAFEADINAIAAAGITSGCNSAGTRFCPSQTTRRDQMASFLGRFLDLTPTTPPPRDQSAVSVDDSIRTFFPDIYDQAVSVARCESGLNPRAVNPAGFHGLFQIASAYHRSSFERVTGQSWDDGIYTAYYNSQFARYLYDQSGSWSAWGCKP